MTPAEALREVRSACEGYANGCELPRVRRITEALSVLEAICVNLRPSAVKNKK